MSPENIQKAAKAEELKEKANIAMKTKGYKEALKLYTEANEIDGTNAVYLCNRAAAHIAMGSWIEAEKDAHFATRLDPTYGKAWSRLAKAQLKLGCAKRAEQSFRKAIEASGEDSTALMKQGFADASKAVKKTISQREVESKRHYRASIIFVFDSNVPSATYTLFTNPAFVTLPPCQTGPLGSHEVHERELLSNYDQETWTVDRLKEHTTNYINSEVIVINATGQGGELLARAWCSERGKNAIIRREGGPCYVCAMRGAAKCGLGTGVLIWVS